MLIEGIYWIAVELDCAHPEASKVRVIEDERQAFWLSGHWLVYEKLPGIEHPKFVPYEVRLKERAELRHPDGAGNRVHGGEG